MEAACLSLSSLMAPPSRAVSRNAPGRLLTEMEIRSLHDIGAPACRSEEDGAAPAFKAKVRAIIADVADRLARDFGIVHARLRGDLANGRARAGVHHGFAGDARPDPAREWPWL